MDTLGKHIYRLFVDTIHGWEDIDDIYALAFISVNKDDDLRFPTIHLMYNTYTQWHATTPRQPRDTWPYASNSDEAKWNQPFWLPTIHASVGSYFDEDVAGDQLRQNWIEHLGLWYDETDSQSCEIKGGQICAQFDDLCVQIAKQLQPVILTHFNRQVPILFFDRESLSPRAIAHTYRANEPTSINEFRVWIEHGGMEQEH